MPFEDRWRTAVDDGDIELSGEPAEILRQVVELAIVGPAQRKHVLGGQPGID